MNELVQSILSSINVHTMIITDKNNTATKSNGVYNWLFST